MKIEDQGLNTEPVYIFGKGSREITRCYPQIARTMASKEPEAGGVEIKKTLPNEEETVKATSVARLRAGETAQGKSFLILGTTFNGTTC